MLFLWVFLPAVLVVNLILGLVPAEKKTRIMLKNRFLLLASLFFYAWGGVYYLLLISAVIIVNYFGALLIVRAGGNAKTVQRMKRGQNGTQKLLLFVTVLLDLGLLFYFKYFNLLIHTIERIARMETGAFGLKEVILPIGISFYIFQALSYVADVYRGKTRIQRNFFDFALYVSLFPQLIAGPIVQYKDIEAQIYGREENSEKFAYGIMRFCYGLGKKVLLANVLAEAVDQIWKLDLAKIGPSLALFGTVCYTLQIYYDFSGYSDMAIGLGAMFGFKFKDNFRAPYVAYSVQDFWRRWHVSLSSWFKEYVYIPLGGNRLGLVRTCINLFLVFLLTGIWHGANYTFFLWGIYYAFFIILERTVTGKYLEKHRLIGRIYTILIVSFGWILFRAPSLKEAVLYIGGFFRFTAWDYSVLQFMSMKMLLALIFGVFLSGAVSWRIGRSYKKNRSKMLVRIADIVLEAAILMLCIFMLAKGTYNPFIYFQF